MAEPQDMILPLLSGMRAESRADLQAMREDLTRGFDRIEARMDRLEKRFNNLREAVNGESVLGR
ncbi:hypothetical protein [Methylobacterium oryzisoli]|uniref:hypothetical protein n=1 Tax=Methylobacterium oryzisoli TaxID=3385502 RepID=UPI0038916EF4